MKFLNSKKNISFIQLGNGTLNDITRAGGKFGSFGFAKCRLVCRAKPNVPFVRLAKIVFKKCAVGKNKNTEALAFGLAV